jgi:TonB family protein
MYRGKSLFAVGLLLAQPAFAANQASKAEKNRQLSEIIFQNYPPRALAAGEQGAVFFIVRLDKDAHPTSCEVTHGSGHPLLDAETCDLIVQHAVFNSARDASGRVVKETTEGVVNWTIPGRSPEPIRRPRTAVEAMATGTCLVATTGGALPEVTGLDNETVLSCPAGDVGALAHTIARGLTDADLRARIGASGRQRVIERWSWRHCAQLTVDQYREVLAMPQNQARLAARPTPVRPGIGSRR